MHMMHQRRRARRLGGEAIRGTPLLLVLLGLFIGAGCAPSGSAPVSPEIHLIPYSTMTPVPSADPATALVQSSTSIVPSPTPFTYKIKAGDTMGQVAQKFNVKLDALQAANPEVDPNSMRVGETLQIPSAGNLSGASTPTPVPFVIQQVGCYFAADNGLWCFALAHNDSPDPIENISAQITLLDGQGKDLATQTALLPMDILPAGASLPLMAYFAPGLPSDLHPQVQVLTAIRLLHSDPRYLDATVRNGQAQVDWSGLAAQASGVVHLSADSRPANRIWVVAMVYDRDGNIKGVRRWESNAALQPGSDMPFSFTIASIAGEIGRVEFVVEARP